MGWGETPVLWVAVSPVGQKMPALGKAAEEAIDCTGTVEEEDSDLASLRGLGCDECFPALSPENERTLNHPESMSYRYKRSEGGLRTPELFVYLLRQCKEEACPQMSAAKCYVAPVILVTGEMKLSVRRVEKSQVQVQSSYYNSEMACSLPGWLLEILIGLHFEASITLDGSEAEVPVQSSLSA